MAKKQVALLIEREQLRSRVQQQDQELIVLRRLFDIPENKPIVQTMLDRIRCICKRVGE